MDESGGGIDTVKSNVDYSLQWMEVENLTLIGDALVAVGNGLNNVILGNAGNNTLTGGGGSDTLTGGEGDDRFLLASNQSGIIADFRAGAATMLDEIGLSRALFADFAGIRSAAAQVGYDAVIAKGSFHLTLRNVQVSALDASDFYFV